MDKIMITIGRQFGSGGREIGKKIARELEIPYYDKELLAVAAKESGLALDFLQDMDEKHPHSLLYSLCVGRPNLVLGNCNISVERMASKAQREAVLHVAGQGRMRPVTGSGAWTRPGAPIIILIRNRNGAPHRIMICASMFPSGVRTARWS